MLYYRKCSINVVIKTKAVQPLLNKIRVLILGSLFIEFWGIAMVIKTIKMCILPIDNLTPDSAFTAR